MLKKPNDEVMKKIILHDGVLRTQICFEELFVLGKKCILRGRELGKNNVVAKEPYTQRVIERVQQIKLPFNVDHLYHPNVYDLVPISIEDTNKLKVIVA